MILRRISDHVSTQNWTAIALDFLIVVLGVFIGIQVSNWNASVHDSRREARILEQLHGEFEAAMDLTRSNMQMLQESMQANRDVLRALRDGKEPADEAAFLARITRAHQFPSGPSEPETLTELLQAGELSDLSSPSLRAALVRYHDIIIQRNETILFLYEGVTAPADGFYDAVHMNPDFTTFGDLLESYEWERMPAAEEQFQRLLLGKQILLGQTADSLQRGERVLAEIEAMD